MARNDVQTLEDRFDSLKESVVARLGDVKDSVVSGTRASVSRTGSLIKEHPIAAIAIAFGIGYVAMRMMRR
ncbi:MAG: hypothetical protein ACM31C_14395 [Acidobacteriota bacterium]